MSLSAFLQAAGWQNAHIQPMTGDASARQYARLHSKGRSAILMQAPNDGSTHAFVAVDHYLRAQSLAAPTIYAAQPDQGLLITEDFGDTRFADVTDKDAANASNLYELATDVLIHLSRVPAMADRSIYDGKTMATQAALIFEWALPGKPLPDQTMAAPLKDALIRAALPFDRGRRVTMLRDYHAENLMLREASGLGAAGLLDFQDAMLAHPAYDLVSLLQDARRDVDPAIEEEMTFRYMACADHDSTDFYAAYALYGVGRALRILGIFARLASRDGKTRYLDFVPRVRANLIRNLAHPHLSDVAGILDPWLESTT
ncbi:aminoglycoside phosphotransferase family protein [Donghicola sp. XS_ASV15]|uniref:aminoglycoside phosphotransferase family protein n=1 Tax=Donghicola sp. XS_ASV15 TaxID=3241295 RepID=UPI003515EF81